MTNAKILVEITELDERVHFKKCKVNRAGQVSIYNKGGRGKGAESPPLPNIMFRQSSFFGLITKRYARYRRGTNVFMDRNDPDLPPLALEMIQNWINNDSFNSFFGDKKIQFIFYLIFVVSAFGVLLGILPYVR